MPSWPGRCSAAGPVRLAMHWQRVTRAARQAGAGHGSRSAAASESAQAIRRGPRAGWQRAWPRPRPSGGHLKGPGSGYPGRPGVRVTQKVRVGKAGTVTVTVTPTVARSAAARARPGRRGPARRRDLLTSRTSLVGITRRHASEAQAGCQCPAPSRARRLPGPGPSSRLERSRSRRRASCNRAAVASLCHPPWPPALGGAATGARLEARWTEQP